jgi:hypothetical protein
MAQPPLSTGFPGNAGSPRDAAMAINKQNSDLLMAANKIGKGGRKNRYWGGDGKVVVPLMKPLFQDPSAGTDQSVKSVTLSGVGQINQQSLNNKMIGSVVTPAQPIPASQLQKGGCGCDWKGGKRSRRSRRTRRMGGTRIMGPNQTWGCYSGGKKRKMSKKNKMSKKRRSTRRR